ncbi:hypothetical protein LJR074_002585 [Acidovorax sp. LjRoot74]|uniref:hypothetical protein n=1 Tax=Acidovorax sp. LjRoot74 TaxID=3342337 RepID=UPI003ECE355D
MQLNITIKGFERVKAQMEALSGAQLREAAAKALNDAGHQVRRDMQRELTQRFDRPTPFIVRSPKVFQATADDLVVTIAPTLHTDKNAFVRGGKVGVDPQQVLQAQEFGGLRRDKRSESVLRRAGILPAGWQTAIPRQPFPGSDDGNGNLKGPFLRSVLAFLQAFAVGQGHYANMGADAKDRVRRYGKGTLTKAAQRQAGPFRGRAYFVAYGRAESPFGKGIVRNSGGLAYGKSRTAHLAAGIWAKLGEGKGEPRPVLMFIKPGKGYTPRIDLDGLGKSAATQDYLARRLRFRIRQAAEALGG